jgi:uncharacterized protein DUF4166/saccharopine dehydrogenase-like protein
MSARLCVLILGGYGTFGGRLAQLLADEPRLTLVIAGRSQQQAEAFCARHRLRAALVPQAFDRDGDVEAQLARLKPDLIVDASGPFQSYGADPYRIVRAALALGIDYLDLADASGFVAEIGQFDAQAKARGVFVLAGVSTFPVLTAAVARALGAGMDIDAISGGIAPSPYAGVGLNVIRAIAGYAGKPIALLRAGEHAIGYGLTETRRCTVAPPGRLPLRNLRFSLVDVPDLQVLPRLWPSLRSVWMGAGPVPGILHRALNACAWAIRFKLLPTLSPLAGLMHGAINVLRWGEHRGGMFVRIEGDKDGKRIERSWHLLAEGDDGPLIPSMGAEAIIRRCLDGQRPQPGARAATEDLELADYDALFARRAIITGHREVSPAYQALPLYRRLLGEAYALLPAPLQAMHDLDGEMIAGGSATVERGGSLLARLAAALIGFPQAGKDVPVKVAFKSERGRETWRRTFAGRSFFSTQEQGRGRFEWLLCERFGPLNAGMALVLDSGRMRLIVRRWSLFGIPMPLALAPRGDSYEYAENGRFHFHVEITHPLTGLILRYRGWLVPRA